VISVGSQSLQNFEPTSPLRTFLDGEMIDRTFDRPFRLSILKKYILLKKMKKIHKECYISSLVHLLSF
jgi:hypothetical protein